jgi:polyhydroxyalkanoate synthase
VETTGGKVRAGSNRERLLGEPWRAWRRFLSIPQVVHAALETRVCATPSRAVLREGTHELLRFSRQTPATHAQPVLLCYALVNRPYILDLEPGKSVVEQYLRQGFEVYLIDWGVPSDEDRSFGLDHYVGFLAKAVDFVRRVHQQPSVHLLGYCMGGTLAATYAALEPDAVKTLALLAAPLEFSGNGSLLNLWTQARHFDVDSFVDRHGNCPAWFLQTCFLFMNPVRNFFDKPIAFYEHMDDPRSVASTFALERWLNDNIPVAGEIFRQFVKQLYQRNELVKGELTIGGRRVDLRRLRSPLLLLTARNDHLVPPEATEGIRPYVGSPEVTSMGSSAGHVGLVVGGKAHERFWPDATRWVAERSTPTGAPSGSPKLWERQPAA